MDHEIEDDVDIERARGEDGKTMRLKKHGATQADFSSEYRRIEALKMTGLQNTAVFLSQSDEIICFRKAGGKGFFDEEVKARIKQCGGHRMMMHRGHGDGGGIEREISLLQIVNRGKD